jgi:hypothetical protein
MNEKRKQVLIIVFISCIFLLFIGLLTFFIVKKKYHENYERSRTFRLKKKENLVDIKKNSRKPAQKKYTVNVINMDKDANRLEAFNKLWDDFFFIQRFPAVKINSKVNKPHNACGLSHYNCALNYFEQNPNENIAIIMEDDSTPFHGLDLETLNEYLDILEKNSDSFDVANLGPYIWESNYQPKKKCVVYSQAPEHYTLVYNGDNICALHFYVINRSMIPLLKQLRRLNSEDSQLNFICDRIFAGSLGAYTIPFIRLLLPNVLFAFQEDFVSNNEKKVLKIAVPSILNILQQNIEKLWNSRLNKEIDIPFLEYFKRNSLLDISQPNSVKSEITLIIPINFDVEKDAKELLILSTIIETFTAPIVLLMPSSSNSKEYIQKIYSLIQKYRYKNWPIDVKFIDDKNNENDNNNKIDKNLIEQVYDSVIDDKNFNIPKTRTKYYYWHNLNKNNTWWIDVKKNKRILGTFFPSFSKIDILFNYNKNFDQIKNKNKNEKEKFGKEKEFIFKYDYSDIIGTKEGWLNLCKNFKGNVNKYIDQNSKKYFKLKQNVGFTYLLFELDMYLKENDFEDILLKNKSTCFRKENCLNLAFVDFWEDGGNCPKEINSIQDKVEWEKYSSKNKIKIQEKQKGSGLLHKKSLEYFFNKNIHIVDDPGHADLLICSVFGTEKEKFPEKKKIMVCYEYQVPPIKNLNNSNTLYISSKLSFEQDNNNNSEKINNFYMPLYIAFYGFDLYKTLIFRKVYLTLEDFQKKEDCLSIISNKSCELRNNFIIELMKKIKVHNYGKLFNNKKNSLIQNTNWFDPRLSDEIKKYKFIICMENNSINGYHTEKIMHGFKNNIIPIYWGDPTIKFIFNSKAYINVNELGFENAILKIEELCSDYHKYLEMLKEPIFTKDSILFSSTEFTKYLKESEFQKTLLDFISSTC